MASTVVVDSSDVSYSPLHSPTRQHGFEIRSSTRRQRRTISDDFGKYEKFVLLVTQLSYIPVACTMLSTSFYKPSEKFCDKLTRSNNTMLEEINESFDRDEYYSLLMEWGEGCNSSMVLTVLSTAIMLGALFGAFLAGWLADVYGRKPVLRGSLIMVSLGNLIFSFIAPYSWVITSCLLFILGMSCGGYMVTNLVLVVECIEHAESRLLAVSMNGWSASMISVAVLAYLTKYWFTYHLVISLTALLATLACQYKIFESCRWLAGVHRLSDAKSIALKICRLNGQDAPSELTWYELLGFQVSIPSVSSSPQKQVPPRRYGYTDLFSYPSVYRPLLSLFYCFVASSIVSFGFYFVVDMLPGNRYTTMGIMGSLKFALGLIPFLASPWMGRKPIVSISLTIACISAWTVCLGQFLGISSTSISITILSLLVAGSLDPTWKISHLYSAELFPTVVRNMARGVCNVGARMGSVAAPLIVHLRFQHYLLPFIVFACLLSIQLLVVILFLPETKNRPLPDYLPEDCTKENEKFTLESIEGSSNH